MEWQHFSFRRYGEAGRYPVDGVTGRCDTLGARAAISPALRPGRPAPDGHLPDRLHPGALADRRRYDKRLTQVMVCIDH